MLTLARGVSILFSCKGITSSAGQTATACAGRGCRGPGQASLQRKKQHRRFAGINRMKEFWKKAKPTIVTAAIAIVAVVVFMWAAQKWAPTARVKVNELSGL